MSPTRSILARSTFLAAAVLLGLPPAGGAQEADDEGNAEDAPPAATAASSPDERRVWYDEVNVTATRSDQAAGEIPLGLTLLEPAQIQLAPDRSMLDLLRTVPTLSMSRGAGDLIAQPRDQAVSLRGLVGGSQSRALTLVDGLPLTDPYGGFVIWSAVPKEVVERVEIVRGGGSSAWGNLALSGVVHLITRAPSERTWSVSARHGNENTNDLNLFFSDLGSRWTGWIAGDAFDTDGYIDLEPATRGPIDEAKRREYRSLRTRLGLTLSPRASLRIGASRFDEDRDQGLPTDRDHSEETAISAALELWRGGAGSWQLQAFHRDLDTRSSNGTVDDDRTTAVPTSEIRRLPTRATGLGAIWSGEAGGRHELTTGADVQRVDFERIEDIVPRDGLPALRYTVRGEQTLGGLFLQDAFRRAERWSFSFGTRFDRVSNRDGESFRTDLATGVPLLVDRVPDHEESTLNPSLGVVYAVAPSTRLRAAAYTGFRSPTPAEAFVSQASAGARRNAPNPALAPETLTGAEAGIDYTPSRELALRLTGFWNEVQDLVQRITVGRSGSSAEVIEPCGLVPPRGSCVQRRNVGEIRSVGVEIDADWRPTDRWRLTLGAALIDAEVTDNPPAPELVGNQIERAADQQVTLSVDHHHPRFGSFLVRGRHVSERFDDAENERALPAHQLVDLAWSRPISPRFELFAGVENVFDRSVVVRIDSDGGSLGAPRLYHLGVRIRSLPGR
jgi:outer membrane receptor protein involved in Fe transport